MPFGEKFKNIFSSSEEGFEPQEQKQWDKYLQEINEDYPELDKKIKQLVAALWVNGFSTYESCQGHLEERELPTPRIYLGYKRSWLHDRAETERLFRESGLPRKEAIQKVSGLREIRERNDTDRNHLEQLLEEFYKTRKEVDLSDKLCIKNYGELGEFILTNQATDLDLMNLYLVPGEDTLTLEEKKNKLNNRQKEMLDFSDFLKKKFFN